MARSGVVVQEVAEAGLGDEGVGEGQDEGEVVVGEFVDGGELVAEGVLGWARPKPAYGSVSGSVSMSRSTTAANRGRRACPGGLGGRPHARRRLIVFFQYCAEAEVPELYHLARTIDRWADEVLAYHRTSGASNGRVENTHMLAEKIRRNAHGFTNHANYRRRLLGRLGIKWATVPPRRIRGRKPRSVA